MTHIGDSLPEATTPHPVPAEPEPSRPDERARTNALLVIRGLTGAGCKAPFDFDQEAAADLWAVKLSAYPVGVLMEAAQSWIDAPGNDFPSLGDMEQAARIVAQEHEARRVQHGGICPECEGDHWVRVVDSSEQVETFASKKAHRLRDGTDDGNPDKREYIEVAHHHMRPCSTCPGMRQRYELYMAGHFEGNHVAGGGCSECYDYTPAAMRARARKNG